MIFTICHIILTLSLAMSAWRLFKGPTAADRILAIDLLAVITAAAVILHALETKQPVFIDVIVVLGVIVFFGTVALGRTLKRTP
ncbi:MAG: monovalent cation/H+ antiporter complex subunit F [Luteolibacter sp.]